MLKHVYIFATSLRLVYYTTAMGLLFVSNQFDAFYMKKKINRKFTTGFTMVLHRPDHVYNTFAMTTLQVPLVLSV